MSIPKDTAEYEVVRKMSSYVPQFQEVFDEETFYIFALMLAGTAIVVALLASRYVTLKDAGHRD